MATQDDIQTQASATTEETAAATPKPQENRRAQPNKNQVSQAIFRSSLQINTRYAQTAFKRSFNRATRALYALSIILRAYADDSQADQINALADEKIQAVVDDIEAEKSRIGKLIEDNGIDADGIEYTVSEPFGVEVNSPRAIRYMKLIAKFDELVKGLDALWLSGVFTDSQYSKSAYDWQNRIIKLSFQIRSLAQRSISLARKSNRGDDDAEKKMAEELLQQDDDENDEEKESSSESVTDTEDASSVKTA